MSKRLGNFYTLRDLLNKGYTGRDVRYMLLHTHYRTQLNFTFEGLDGAVHSLERLDDFVRRLKTIKEEKEETVSPLLTETEAEFTEALGDDLNISVALASLFELVRKINGLIDQNKIGKKDAESILALLNKFNTVLGVLKFEPEEEIIPQELEELLRKREEARGSKNWKIADECRDKILASGYLIEDTPHGARLKKKKS
jgi:cysteinyl-tRNA synthetase